MQQPSTDDDFLQLAIEEAKKGLSEGGIPIGSVLVVDGKVIGSGHNRRHQNNSVILHAEMDCLENAGRISSQDYRRATIYSTLSCCDMCSGAILLYKIPRVVVGENVTFQGPESYLKSRGVEFINKDNKECKELMKSFILSRSTLWQEDISVTSTDKKQDST